MYLKNKTSKCFHCVHYFPLTKMEKEEFEKSMRNYLSNIRDISGVCIGSNLHKEYFLQRIFTDIFTTCSDYEEGISRENLHIQCQSCQTGEISICRPFVNNSTLILIGCNRYPDCDFKTYGLKIETKCRFCGSNLILSGGNILTCRCPECGKVVKLPISPRVFPAFARPYGGCVHTDSAISCNFCDASRKQRKSLLEIELPQFLLQEYGPSRIIPRKSFVKPLRKIHPTYFSEDDPEEDGGQINEDAEMDFYRGSKDPYDDSEYDDYQDFARDWYKLTNEDEGGNSFF